MLSSGAGLLAAVEALMLGGQRAAEAADLPPCGVTGREAEEVRQGREGWRASTCCCPGASRGGSLR